MKKIATWYKNTRLSTRVIMSMNATIFVSIILISILASLNRINVQKKDAFALVDNELSQVINLLDLLQDRPISDLKGIIEPRIIYNTGFISVIAADGEVLLCRERSGKNVSDKSWFKTMKQSQKGEFNYVSSETNRINHQYHIFYQPLDVYVTANIEKKEYIDKPVMNTLRILLFALVFTWLTFSLANYFIMKTVTTPINGLVKVVKELGDGNLPDNFDYPYKDEVGQMAGSVNDLIDGLKETAIFASEIGRNNFDHPYKPLSDRDVLGNALLNMRQSLKTASEEEKVRKVEDEKRNWTTQGLARFADILRQNNDNLNELSYQIIKNLVDYLGINQGGVFILKEDDERKEKWLELTACYAFDRRKFLDKKIMIGEGLVGTCFLEKAPVYITKVPQDYIRITSGLGDENPSALLLIPLVVNDKIFGVIELASFSVFEKYKMEFVEKIGESIASTISAVKINSQTAMLLQKSQQQAEEMRAQEEEMRQNMEELAATQEAMAEKERENIETIERLTRENQNQIQQLEAREKEMTDILEDCPEGVVKADHQGNILFFNKAAEKLWGYLRREVVGKNVKVLMNKTDESLHDFYMESYVQTGHKKIIGKGRDVEILLQKGDTAIVFLTIVETRLDNKRLFTGFFTDRNRFANNQGVDPQPDIDLRPDFPEDTITPNEDKVVDENETANTDSKTTNMLEDTSADANSLDHGEITETQKAWSEHITHKGKDFRKSKKK